MFSLRKHFGCNVMITFFTTAFSRWNILSRGLVNPLPFLPSAGTSHWKIASSLLEKPLNTFNSRSECPGRHRTGQLQLCIPARCSTGGQGVSPQQLGAVRHLHGSCCASPSDPSCRSIAVCWGPGMLLTQLCSAGRFPMDWKRTADSRVTLTLASWQSKIPSTHPGLGPLSFLWPSAPSSGSE